MRTASYRPLCDMTDDILATKRKCEFSKVCDCLNTSVESEFNNVTHTHIFDFNFLCAPPQKSQSEKN